MEEDRKSLFDRCADIARAPRILDVFAAALGRCGLAGEALAAMLLYLVVTTRVLDDIVSAAIKGPSAAGKSHLVNTVLRFMPNSAHYVLSAMSERALVYSSEPLRHRFLVLYEAAGLQGQMAAYIVRSLLSEGQVRYATVVKTKNGLEAKEIVREGPTGLLVTTTLVRLNRENETRLFSIPTADTPEQTKLVLQALAEPRFEDPEFFLHWHALQEWVALGPNKVHIPFARAIADHTEPRAVRIRRDFRAVLALIKAHALLHQESRRRGEGDSVIATRDDYAVVLDLVKDLIAETVEASVAPTTVDTVVAASALLPTNRDTPLTVVEIARKLGLDKSAAWRRVQVAIEAGFLRNRATRPYQPAEIVLGDPLPLVISGVRHDVLPPADHPALQGFE